MGSYYRRRRRRGRGWWTVPAAAIVFVAAWWVYPALGPTSDSDVAFPALQAAAPTADIPTPTDPPPKLPTADPDSAPINAPPIPQPAVPKSADTLIVAGREALARGDLLIGRAKLSEALQLGVDQLTAAALRNELLPIGAETILSPRIVDNDPLVTRYVIQTGDSLAKIAAMYKVSPELLASVNGMADKNLIRAGQTIKVVKGPFRAVVRKQEFVLEVYLGDTFVRHFRVGLGAADSTPTGDWEVGTKLINPTYYPPRGGGIVSADDPANPLGERWIGLLGVSGSAVGQQRYGVHGTSEPDSIGKNASLGCIRLVNDDVELVYAYLVEKHSTVTVIE
ncbi:MAG: L,D-transpeptidase family protein [Planctomycetota bacterium]